MTKFQLSGLVVSHLLLDMLRKCIPKLQGVFGQLLQTRNMSKVVGNEIHHFLSFNLQKKLGILVSSLVNTCMYE